jgi:hypothetical protein
MRRWLIALATAVVASGVGVSVNVATDLKTNLWAWVVVAVLTVAAAGVAVWAQRPRPDQQPPVTAGGPGGGGTDGGGTHNEMSGEVAGSVVQGRDFTGPIRISSDGDQITQNALGFGNASIQQAGGDINDRPRRRRRR